METETSNVLLFGVAETSNALLFRVAETSDALLFGVADTNNHPLQTDGELTSSVLDKL